MTHPREAIFDVLLAQRARAVDVERDRDTQTAWTEYEAGNRTAHAVYTGGVDCPHCGERKANTYSLARHMQACRGVPR